MTNSTTGTGPTPPRKPKAALTAIGNRKLSPATMMMGHGYDPVLSEGSLKAPIFLTSTFAFASAAEGKRFFEGITGKRPGGTEGLVYSRFNGPNQQILEGRLSLWDGAEESLVFSSGMTAICVLFLCFCSAGDVIVHSGPLYAASEGFVAKTLSRFGVTYLDFPAGATRAEIADVLTRAKAKAASQGGKVAMVYLESPANPTNDWSTSKRSRPRAMRCWGPIARSRSTTPSWGRCGSARSIRARTSWSIR